MDEDKPQQATPQEAPDAGTEDDATRTDWKAMSRKWEERAKANTRAVDELQAMSKAHAEDQERIKGLTKQLDEMKSADQRRQWRQKVSEETGVPAGLLRGSTLEDLRAHAKALLAWNKPANDPVRLGNEPASPKPNPELEFARKLFSTK